MMKKDNGVSRVCCFCERWESGGIESFLFNVLMRIDPKEAEVDVVASSIGESIYTAPLKKRGVKFFELSGSQRRVLTNHSIFRRIIRERKYNVVHINAFHGLSLAYLKIAEEEGIQIRIAHSHGAGLRESRTKACKLVLHNIAKYNYIRYSTDLLACSASAASFLFPKQTKERQNYCVIRNGIDIDRFRFNAEERELQRKRLGLDSKLIIGNVGRLSNEKNQIFLLDVLSELLRIDPDAYLILVGEGNEKDALQKRACKLGVMDKVMFYGKTSKVEKLLWAMDVFAFPSLMEGLGIAAIEAQAAGLPVICSQYIPAEAHITSHIYSVPLSSGPVAWANSILEHAGRFALENDMEKLELFDIKKTAEQITSYYLKGTERCKAPK